MRKAILRAAGVIALHDEDAVFRSETANLRLARLARTDGVDPAADGHRVQGGVARGGRGRVHRLAVSAGGPEHAGRGRWVPPRRLPGRRVGGVAVHRPLARVPENTLKFGSACDLRVRHILVRRRAGLAVAGRDVRCWRSRPGSWSPRGAGVRILIVAFRADRGGEP